MCQSCLGSFKSSFACLETSCRLACICSDSTTFHRLHVFTAAANTVVQQCQEGVLAHQQCLLYTEEFCCRKQASRSLSSLHMTDTAQNMRSTCCCCEHFHLPVALSQAWQSERTQQLGQFELTQQLGQQQACLALHEIASRTNDIQSRRRAIAQGRLCPWLPKARHALYWSNEPTVHT